MVPEKRSFQVLVADQAKIAASLVVSDAQLRQAYSGSMDNFRMPERVKARHILLMTQGKSDAEKKQALTKAQDLLWSFDVVRRCRLGEEEFPGPRLRQNGGILAFVRGQTVPSLKKWRSRPPKEISDVVTTQYGYHIIQVMEKSLLA